MAWWSWRKRRWCPYCMRRSGFRMTAEQLERHLAVHRRLESLGFSRGSAQVER